MTQPYEKYELWQNAFQGRLDDEPSRRLATAYSKAWQHGCSIAKRIASDAAGLTLHDEAHFLSLWKCASLVAGPGVKLSPIEAFILGVAILIHDAAHTVIAYEGGMAAIESTPEWQDALSARLPRDDDGPLPAASSLSEQLRREALFDTVRTLHASQATKLLQVPFKHSGFDANFYIIEDPSLRHHFGELIGKIAASHHWNLSRLEALGRTTNAVSPFDEFGPIRPILLAALLRTADAIQIDSSRAPDFEFALSDPKGVSRDHWSAQSKIATGADAFDGSALVVSSTKSFGDDDIAAWWVAYDLARNADKELREVDVFLHDHRLDRFKLTHVKDISSPSKFSEHVKPNGWVPINAEVKVTNTAKLIEVFGGRELYGNDEVVPLRELIQNAVDAVRARRLLTPSYRGRVVVSLMQEPDFSGKLVNWFRVSDDGIGMSMSVLTGPFMTFGETGWASSLLRSERPGFVGKRFRPIGRYGIGFFSVFMIGNEIKVSTKPFESGADHFKTLHFREGVALRPIVKATQLRWMIPARTRQCRLPSTRDG